MKLEFSIVLLCGIFLGSNAAPANVTASHTTEFFQEDWICPCHLCTKVVDFALTILPSCPEPDLLDELLGSHSICNESCLSDYYQECNQFLDSFYGKGGNLKKIILEFKCFDHTQIEIDDICGPRNLSCCNLIF